MSKSGELAQDEIVSRRKERRIVFLASSFGFLMFLGLVACLPSWGPVFRVFTNPSSSMLPTIRVGGYSVISATGLIVRRGPDLDPVLRAIDRSLSVVAG